MHRLPLFTAFGLVCALAASVPAGAAEEHYYTLIAADKVSATFAEDNGRRSRDGSIRLSVLRVLDGGPVAYATYQMMIHCGTQKAQTLEGVNYSRDGHPSPIEGEAQATPIKSGTMGSVLKSYICDGIDPYPRSKTLKSLAEARDRAAELIDVEKAR